MPGLGSWSSEIESHGANPGVKLEICRSRDEPHGGRSSWNWRRLAELRHRSQISLHVRGQPTWLFWMGILKRADGAIFWCCLHGDVAVV